MSESQQVTSSHYVLTSQDESAKTNAIIAYALMALGIFTGFFWLIGAIWAMVKRSDAQGSIFVDHYDNMIKTFWWGLLFWVIGLVLAFILIGYLVFLAVWIWSVYRIVKGLAQITSNKPFNG